MSFERPRPLHPLFTYDDLETLVGQQLPHLINILDEGVEQANPLSVFIDQSLEYEHPQSIAYTDALTHVLIGEPSSMTAQQACYRAFHFAHTVGSLVLPTHSGMKMQDFFAGVSDTDALRDKLQSTSCEYLGRRKHLDALTGRFMPQLDPTDQFAHVVETIAGSTFMFIDAAEKQRVIDEQAASFRLVIEGL